MLVRTEYGARLLCDVTALLPSLLLHTEPTSVHRQGMLQHWHLHCLHYTSCLLCFVIKGAASKIGSKVFQINSCFLLLKIVRRKSQFKQTVALYGDQHCTNLTKLFFFPLLLLILDRTAFKPICMILNAIQCYIAFDVFLSNVSYQTN